MKKFSLIFIFIFFFLTLSVQAQTLKVISLDKFSTENPSPICRVQIPETSQLTDEFFLEAGTIITGLVIKTHGPECGKRDGYVEIIPTSITYNDKTTNITNSRFTATVVAYKPINPQALAGNVAIKAANFFVLGSSQLISFTMGAFQAENGTRIKSGVERMYKDSFVSFIEAGSELKIEKGDVLILKIKKTR